MIEQHIKEGLSRAYTLAVAHKAGFNCSKPEYDYGIDGSIKDVQIIRPGRYLDCGFSIDYQLKCTVNVEYEKDHLKYDLEAKTYNDLIIEDVGTPRILILFVLPSDQSQWLNISTNHTILKNCAWWYSLKGMPPTNNENTIRIRIPLEQILTEHALSELMSKVRKGEELCNLA
ncbi:DUF4365 domain-containing protein [Cohnella sp. GCM10012308]|uniref:DUF4365 domain-containing protein n=1 Tax=Cohnella sp. GCM10012308 TaxID=3317329 RepID=UPI00361F585F